MSQVLQANRVRFGAIKNHYEHLASDIESYASSNVIYSFDFSLLHPFLFPSADISYLQYDQVGRNIFSLLEKYHSSAGFKPTVSGPSLIELLDALAHRVDRLDYIISSKEEVSKASAAFQKMIYESENGILEQGSVSSYLSQLKLSRDNTNFSRFIAMLSEGKILNLRSAIDPEIFKHKDFKRYYERALEAMMNKRAQQDRRPIDDRVFHYKVDAWNIAASIISTRAENTEVDHICRGGIEQYYPIKNPSLYARNPFVPLIRLFSLLRTPGGGFFDKESKSFVEFGIRDIAMVCKKLAEIENIGDLSLTEQEEIDRVHNKYFRPLFFDYSIDGASVESIYENQRRIHEAEMGKYKSILTEQGLREQFAADAEDIRATAQGLVGENPLILDERLLGDYDLDNNPRVIQIRKKLDLA